MSRTVSRFSIGREAAVEMDPRVSEHGYVVNVDVAVHRGDEYLCTDRG